MIPVLLLADDLTGALDSTVPFAARGMNTCVALGVDAIAAALATLPEVLAVDLDTRSLSADAAAARIDEVWQALGGAAPNIVMKKVDSRLKGPVAAETAALLRRSHRRAAAICAAVPEQGRIVVDRHITGPGIDMPIDAAARFDGVPCTHHDATNADDLSAIASTILKAPGDLLAVGARGLADALAELLAGQDGSTGTLAIDLPMVLTIGSRDPITLAQVDRLCRDHPDQIRDAATRRDGAPVLLVREPEAEDASPAAVAARLAERTVALARATRARTILCSGGDTAAAVMHSMGVTYLVPERELCPGIPVSRIPGEPALRLVTKSGGFGDPDILSRIVASSTATQGMAAA